MPLTILTNNDGGGLWGAGTTWDGGIPPLWPFSDFSCCHGRRAPQGWKLNASNER